MSRDLFSVSKRNVRIPKKEKTNNATLRVIIFSLYLSLSLSLSQQNEVTPPLPPIGTLSALLEHKQECLLELLQCPNKGEGCGQMLRKEMNSHMALCPNFREPCPVPGCSRKIRRADIEDHRKQCPCRVVACVSCGTSLPWKLLSQHKTDLCPERNVKCPFARYGCRETMKAKELAAHLEGSQLAHLTLKCEYLEDERAQERRTNRNLRTIVEGLLKRVRKLEESHLPPRVEES